LLATIALPLAIVTALPPSLAILFLERILKRLCKTWKYSRFRFVQRFFRTLAFETIAYCVGFFIVNWKYGPLPSWTSFLTLALLGVLLVSVVLMDFYNYIGEGVLSLLTFVEEFKSEPDNADFGKLLFCAKRISKIAKLYNMEISPYSLSLGMTVSFIENNEVTQKDFGDMVEWIQCSTNEENFKKFRKLVKKFNSIAKKSSKDGIMEKHHWSFETMITLLSVVVIPIAVAIIAIIVPKLLEKY